MGNKVGSDYCFTNASQSDSILFRDSECLKLACEILKLSTENSPNSIGKKIPKIIKSITGISAVGLRLKSGNDFKICSLEGFSESFVADEKSLICKKVDLCSGNDRKSVFQLSCLCGWGLSGSAVKGKNVTEYGSFWVNDSLCNIDCLTNNPDVFEPRDRCIKEGYRSIVIIPLRSQEVIIGLLLLCDKRPNIFDLKIVEFFEYLAESIAALLDNSKKQSLVDSTTTGYDDVFREFPGVIFKLDLDGTILFVSGNISDYYIMSSEDLSQKNILSLDVLNISKDYWEKSVNKIVASKKSIIDKVKIKGSKGITIFQLKILPRLNINQEVVSLVLTLRNITNDKEIEEHYNENKKIIYSALDSSPVGVLIVKASTGRIIYSNEVANHFKKNFVKMSLDDDHIVNYFSGVKVTNIKGEVFELTGKSIDKIIKSGSKIRKHLNLVNNSGECLVINFNSTPITNSYGEVIAETIIFVNITDIVKLKIQSTEFYERFKTLFYLSSDTVVLIKLFDGSIIDVNNSYSSMFGLKRSEVIGKKVQDLGVCENSEVLKEYFISVKRGNKLENIHIKLKRANGEVFDASVFAERINHSGSYYIICIIRDISENIKLTERIKQSEKMSAIGQLVGGVAHDFNNQLTGILGYSDFLVENLENEELKKYALNIAICAMRSADLTEKLLAFSRKSERKKVPIDIHILLKEVINMLEHSIDKKITIGKKFDAKVAKIVGDPSQLQNALLNLAINARDAMLDDVGMISFITENVELDREFCACSNFDINPGKFVSLKIKDTGSGMNDEIISKIFEPFFTTKDEGKGTGMGLAGVFTTVQQHKGAIEVKSKLGYGTTFELLLPEIVDNGAEHIVKDIPEKKIKGKGHVLLVDDEEIVRIIGSQMLTDLGYTVTVCANGYEAVKFFEENYQNIDLVILDMIMPRMRGREAFMKMIKIDKSVKVLIASGYAGGGEIEDVVEMGAVGVMKKPFYFEELAEQIKSILIK